MSFAQDLVSICMDHASAAQCKAAPGAIALSV
jgi:hypothetical protein